LPNSATFKPGFQFFLFYNSESFLEWLFICFICTFRIKSAPKWRQRTVSDYKNVGRVGVTKPILTIRQSWRT